MTDQPQHAVDAQDVIRHLAQQVADQAVTIAMLRAQAQQMQDTHQEES